MLCSWQPIRSSVEVIIAKGMTVLDAKTVVVEELHTHGIMSLAVDR